ncbi:MAG TPA: exodeoxyribonuclease VII large subunit [Gemmatimonadales bacterium]|nr:exodeoxyribonuclease VII large subunit [Gemmatimonadales bacterium]
MGAGVDLFAQAAAEGALTVGDFTRRARAVVENGLPPLWIRGEVSGFKRWRSGHWYFALRDRSAQIRCVMFAKENRRLPTEPADGMQVYVFARPTIWEDKGEFRLTVLELMSTERDGLWQLAFQKAKAALERDGLLEPGRKRPLPAYAERIAIITSPDAAALRDIAAIVRQRWPLAELMLVSTRVQGDGAEGELCAAFAKLKRIPRLDVVIVGRGGGSKEDLWTFNSERVVRALAAACVPVISAVGHETDVTLADLVADFRAATPSAAAAAATPDCEEVEAHVAHLATRLGRSAATRVERAGQQLERLEDRLDGAVRWRLERDHQQIAALAGRLDALSPLKILDRGYSLARDAAGRVLKRVAQLEPGSAFRLRVTDGEVHARVNES